MKNKVIGLLSKIFIILLAISSLFGLVMINVKATEGQPTLTVTARDTLKDGFCANSNDWMYITLSVDNIGDKSVVVSYYAKDGSAICAAGDYYYSNGIINSASSISDKKTTTHGVSTVTLTSSKTSTTLCYYVAEQSQVTITDGTSNNRYFEFVILSATNIQDFTTTSYKCYMSSANNLECLKDSNGYYLQAYGGTYQTSQSTGDVDSKKSIYFNLINDVTAGGITYTRNNAYQDVLNTGYGRMYTQMYIHGKCNFLNTNDFDIYTYIDPNGSKTQIGYWSAHSFYNHKANSDVTISTKYDSYAILDASYGDYVQVYCVNHSSVWDRWANLTYTTYLSDSTLPTCTATYVDSSSINFDGTIRVMVRFSEPIQLSNPDKTSIIGRASGETVKFTYCSGNYTDTLVYEANLYNGEFQDNGSNVNYIYLDSFENAQYASDFGHNFENGNKNNTFSKTDGSTGSIFNYNTKPECNIDLRMPVVDAVTSSDADACTQSRTVSVKFADIQSGTLYYSWSTDPHLTFASTDEYSSQMSLVGDSNDSVTKSFTISDVSGDYFLYIHIRTDFGKDFDITIGRNNAAIDETNPQGYHLDNTKPLIGDINTESDTLTQKVLNLSLSDGSNDYDAGLETVYMVLKTDVNGSYDKSVAISIADTGATVDSKYGIYLGDGCNVYVLNSGLRQVYLTNTVMAQNYCSESGKGLIFSSKAKAYEYLLDCEYQDFYIVEVGSDIDPSTVNNNRADNETHTAVAGQGQLWIRYKKANFFNEDGTYTSDSFQWDYYYYGTTDDLSILEVDLSVALSNSVLNNAVSSNAQTLASCGEQTSLYTLGILDEYGAPDIPSNQCKNNTTISNCKYAHTAGAVSFKEAITFTDEDLFIRKVGGQLSLVIDAQSAFIGLGENEYKTVYLGFYVVDAAGNTTKSDMTFTKYKFDTRTLFDCEFTSDSAALNDDLEEAYCYDLYDLANNSVKLSFVATLDSSEEGSTIGIKSISYQGVVLDESEYDDYFTVTYEQTRTYASEKHPTMIITPKKSGLYSITPNLTLNKTEKYHDPYVFYITNNYEDSTANYEASLTSSVLVNQVYRLTTMYTYMDSSRTIKQVSYSSQSKDATYAYFSSSDVAKEYVKYMEYQDMYLVELTAQMAESLNLGTESNYLKAQGESTVASAGQMWIRYKAKTWTPSSTETAWVYYYHNDGLFTIQTNRLGSLLSAAIDTVVDTIIQKGSSVNLVGSSYTDSYGAPYLDKNLIHVQKEITKNTKLGSTFSSDITYNGDTAIYAGTITASIDGSSVSVPIQTNTVLTKDDYTKIYYSYVSGSMNNLTYTELTYTAGQTYRDALNGATGIYSIREYDENGVHQYLVYIDNLAPTLQIVFKTPTSQSTMTRTLDSSSSGTTIGCMTFSLGAIDPVYESDPYSYVSVYNDYGQLQNTYFMSQLASGNVKLANGSYQILVSDRSGNSFTFSVNCSDSELKFSVSVNESNDYVEVSINRESSEIVRYQVFLNGSDTPLDSTWDGSSTKTEKYTESGYYYIYVQDIYGNEAEEKGEGGNGVSFERTPPSITWTYLDYNNTDYVVYSEATTAMTMTKALGNTYYISTSRPLRFVMAENYEYEITGISSSKLTVDTTGRRVIVTSAEDFMATGVLNDFTITFWYEEYPDIKVTYYVTCDVESPDILLVYTTNTYINSEELTISELQETAQLGDTYTPTVLAYELSQEITSSISNNGVVNSNLIRLNVTDNTAVKSVDIYLTEIGQEEQLFMSVEPIQGKVENIALSRYGTYRIVTYDVFDNENELTFTNISKDRITYLVDDDSQDVRTKDILYGHDNATIKMLEDGILSLQVEDGEHSYIYFFKVENGVCTLEHYICSMVENADGEAQKEFSLQPVTQKVKNASGVTVDEPIEIFSMDDPGYDLPNHFYQVMSKYADDKTTLADGFNLYIAYDANGLLSFKVECVDSDVEVCYRASFNYIYEPYLLTAYLSKAVSDITLTTEDGQIIDIEKDLTYINQTFLIDTTLSEDITEIKISYSNMGIYSIYQIIYPYEKVDEADTRVLADFDTTRNGFYSIKIYNKFGNCNEYIINRSDVFEVLTEVDYEDGLKERFSTDVDYTLKSNGSIMIEAYSTDVTFTVIKDEEVTKPLGTLNGNYYTLTLNDEGSYTVTIVDNKFGNQVIKTFMIDHTNITFDESLLSGYNEAALRKSEGYTNQQLSIEADVLSTNDIAYVSIVSDNGITVLYNALNKANETLDLAGLIDCVGQEGDGTYQVVIKNSFGAQAIKNIYYRSTPTLIITRRISSSKTFTSVEITDSVLANTSDGGVWSNGAIAFDSEASTYVFSVNTIEDTCPKTLEFGTSIGNATIPYEIYYHDEYGFEYSFKATLDRRDVYLAIDPSVETVTIDEVTKTTQNVKANFSLGDCYVSIDGAEEIPYTSDMVFYQDGQYRFTCRDKSGNVSTLVIVKDSACLYQFIDKDSDITLVDGCVTNSTNIVLSSSDNVTITKYYIDDVKQTDNDIDTFKNHGHYVVFLEDAIGNTSVFEFTIISHSVNEMVYSSPNTYFVTALWYSGADGSYSSYLDTGCVIQNANNSEIDVTDNGDYQVTMTSTVYNNSITFSFTIDTTAPKVKLEGCEEGETTLEDVTLSGCEYGDTIYVYKDGKLASTTTIDSLSGEAPTITEGGKYRIVVVNLAGNETVLTFQKTHIVNTAGSVLIIVAIVAAIAGLMTGIILRNKQKFDK